MKQLFQSLNDGNSFLLDVPTPGASGPMLVVESRASVVSVGTERAVVDFGRASWVERARTQPEKAWKAVEKIRAEGLASTVHAIRNHLASPIALGYCQAGIVREVGASVRDFQVGDRVVTNGPHADIVRVSHTLAAKIPDGLSFEAAAFAPLAAIGLQGLRLANPTLGETVVVYGLGIIGLLTVQIARASGCRVIGIDRSAARCAMAERFGAIRLVAAEGLDLVSAVTELTGGVGVDAVLMTLATDSDEPMHLAAAMSRKRGRIVLVGVTGLKLQRGDFYAKELSFQVSCSYGAGRYDPTHEDVGVDYPLPYVRWTEARNFAAVLDLMADGRLDPVSLVTHRFPFEDAARAYDAIAGGQPLGVVLSYPGTESDRAVRVVTLDTRAPTPARAGVIGWIGAGDFSTRMLMPAFKHADAILAVVASNGGVSATMAGRRHGFQRATSDVQSILTDSGVDTVVVATRHASHADLVVRSLEAGKHVFVEKPLALTQADLARVDAAARASLGMLCVGFNRRFAPHVVHAREVLATRVGPLALTITINAGAIPRLHWTQDPAVGGGRIVGEACHFIDLARHLVGSPIRRLQVLTAEQAGATVDDICLLQLRFGDGSVATIQYLANGHKGYPKERVELFFDNRVLRIDDFRTMKVWGAASHRGGWRAKQDKGHFALANAFVKAIRAGVASPIPLDELVEVAAVAIEAAELARRGGGTTSTFSPAAT